MLNKVFTKQPSQSQKNKLANYFGVELNNSLNKHNAHTVTYNGVDTFVFTSNTSTVAWAQIGKKGKVYAYYIR